MVESIISVSVAAFLAGFIFSMPIAGPISILITSNALKGRSRYCNLVTIGASVADFVYVFVAVFGVTRLYSLYKPAMPYIFAAGSIFFFSLGYKIFRTKVDIENLEDKSHLVKKIERKEKGAFYTGLMINFLNPTLFIGVLTSSFFVISLIASLGLNTGGLSGRIDKNIDEIGLVDRGKIENSKAVAQEQLKNLQIVKKDDRKQDQTVYPVNFHLFISICYAFFLSLGSIIWFLLMTFLIIRHRKRFSLKFISAFIRSLGVVLCLFGLYFGYQAFRMFDLLLYI